MPQINCPDCQHPMSDQAKVCPNCNAPRIVGNTKNCVKCGEQIAARQKKCPKCEAPQYDSVPESKSKSTMAKSGSNPLSKVILVLFCMALGAGLMYVYFTEVVPAEATTGVTPEEVAPDAASVSQKNGLYVFINSRPKKPTKSLGSYKYSFLDRIDEILNTKGDNAMDEPNSVLNMVMIDRRLDEITAAVKEQYPDAECVVFTGRLDNCEVYKFKE